MTMKEKTKFDQHPVSASETLTVLLGRLEDNYPTLEEGMEEGDIVGGAPNANLPQELISWRRNRGSDAQAAQYLAQIIPLHEDAPGILMDAMSIGHIQAASWLKNARKFANPTVLAAARDRKSTRLNSSHLGI